MRFVIVYLCSPAGRSMSGKVTLDNVGLDDRVLFERTPVVPGIDNAYLNPKSSGKRNVTTALQSP